ncbi:MAG TPA: hypothetical protein VKV26_09340 [Dehalococcoidia bacterium]|nr:hypothetical protein [Dehalococcoidia bacterium]
MSLTRSLVGTAVLVAATAAVTLIGGGSPTARAQQTPPAARVYGGIQINGQNAPSGAVVTAYSGSALCGTASGNGVYNGTQYFVDIDSSQAACATPGNTLSFKVNGQAANETTTVPQIAGSPVQLNLTVSATPTPSGPTVTYQTGWNIVGGPAGMTFPQAAATLYTLPGGASNYTTISNTTGITAGAGYWAFFGATTTVSISGSSTLPATVSVPANSFAMIGNPANKAVTVSGADAVYTFDPVANSYSNGNTTTLQPGQGAFVYSAAGATVTMQ